MKLEVLPDLHMSLNEVLVDKRVHHGVKLDRLCSIDLGGLHVDIELVSYLFDVVLFLLSRILRGSVPSLILEALARTKPNMQLPRAKLNGRDLTGTWLLIGKIVRQPYKLELVVAIAEHVVVQVEVAILRLQYGNGLSLINMHNFKGNVMIATSLRSDSSHLDDILLFLLRDVREALFV